MVDRLAIAALLAVLAGCTTTEDLRRAELDELSMWLPGQYDNEQQIAAEPGAGHVPRSISIVPVYAPFLSKNVFFFEERTDDVHRRVVTQRLIALDLNDKQIVQGNFQLTDPDRWRAGIAHPDMFKSLMEADVRPMQGCEMLWVRDEGKFTAATDPKHCRISAGGTLGFLDLEMELTSDELTRVERIVNSQGRSVPGTSAGLTEHFRKTGS